MPVWYEPFRLRFTEGWMGKPLSYGHTWCHAINSMVVFLAVYLPDAVQLLSFHCLANQSTTSHCSCSEGEQWKQRRRCTTGMLFVLSDACYFFLVNRVLLKYKTRYLSAVADLGGGREGQFSGKIGQIIGWRPPLWG